MSNCFLQDHRIQQQLANDSAFVDVCKDIVLQRDAKYNDEFLLTTVCLLWHICTPENIARRRCFFQTTRYALHPDTYLP